MDMSDTELERAVFFEHARKAAEAAYAKNPLDADNLTRWGGALVELSQFQNGPESVKMIKEAVSKLEEALVINPTKHETLWCLGNAQTSCGFYTPDHEEAKGYFEKATECFKQAAELAPGNELYSKSLDMSSKASDLHLEFQRQMSTQQVSLGGASASNAKASKKKKNSDTTYDVLGWVILVVAVVAWVGMAKSQVPPQPPR